MSFTFKTQIAQIILYTLQTWFVRVNSIDKNSLFYCDIS